jgi:hypothetical protein
MALNNVYESDKRLSKAELVSLLELVRSCCHSTDEIWPDVRNNMYLDATNGLPDIIPLSSILVEGLSTTGYLSLDHTWPNTSRSILERAKFLLGSPGAFYLKRTYREICSQQRKSGDTIGFRMEPDKTFFWYAANGSRVELDDQYRRAVLDDLVRRFALPMLRKEDKDGDSFEHTDSGKVTITVSLPGGPGGFLCEVRNPDYQAYLEKMDLFVKDYGSSSLDSSWALFSETDFTHRTEPSRSIYETLRKSPLPAKSYDIVLTFFLRSLDGIDQISPLVKTDDDIEIQLCTFSFDKAQYGFSALVGREGSRLRVYSSRKADKKDFSSSAVVKMLAGFL